MVSNGDRVARLNLSKMLAQRIPERAYPDLHASPFAPLVERHFGTLDCSHWEDV